MGACGVRSPTMGFVVAAVMGNAAALGYQGCGNCDQALLSLSDAAVVKLGN